MPGETLARETTLLASFEQMEIRPFPPPEEGMAVIFTSRSSRRDRACESPGRARLRAPCPARAGRQTPDPAQAATADSRAAIRRASQPHKLEPLPALAPRCMRGCSAAGRCSVRRAPDALRSTGRNPNRWTPISIRPIFCSVPSRSPTPPRSCSIPRRRNERKRLFCRSRNSSPRQRSRPRSRNLSPSRRRPKRRRRRPAKSSSRTGRRVRPHDPLHALKAMSPNEKLAIFS